MELISENKLRHIAGAKGLSLTYIEKDYFLTVFLYLIRDVKGIYLKGGTALNKLFLNHARLSEDLDFTITRSVPAIKKEIESIIKKSNLFTKIETDRATKGFTRYKVYYKGYFKRDYIIVDLNRKASVLLKPEKHKVPNFYNLNFSICTLNLREMIAEKIRALITRNQPRDYFDSYFILKKHDVDMALVKRKVKEAGGVFDEERIFKNANKIYSRWESDLTPLTNKKLSFRRCINLLTKKF